MRELNDDDTLQEGDCVDNPTSWRGPLRIMKEQWSALAQSTIYNYCMAHVGIKYSDWKRLEVGEGRKIYRD